MSDSENKATMLNDLLGTLLQAKNQVVELIRMDSDYFGISEFNSIESSLISMIQETADKLHKVVHS